MTNEFMISWTAGFLEGEGSFTYHTSPRISCPQKEIEPLERLQKAYGGKISKPDHVFRWNLYGKAAMEVMENIYSQMSPRRKAQIDNCREKFQNQVPKGGRRPQGSKWNGKEFVFG